MYKSIRCRSKLAATPAAKVVLRFKNDRFPKEYATLDKSSERALSAAYERAECSGAIGETTVVYDGRGSRYVILGLGPAKSFDADLARKAAGSLVRALHRLRVSSASIHVHAAATRAVQANVLGRSLGEGLGLGAFVFDEFKRTDEDDRFYKPLIVTADDPRVCTGIVNGISLADAANVARRLAATPPNVATPAYVAREAQRLARSSASIRCTVLKGAALEKNKLTGLINVGKASENHACLIELLYTPRGKSNATIVLVGKTITYDTGGLSLKISNGMKGMKYDKCGGMAVLGAMHAVAKLRPKCKVVALMPAAENSVSDEAYRPDDIIRYPNGVSVEVTNTDAEGRLVLADGLNYGCKRHKPDAIIDLATLTGGMVVALGGVCAGYWCEDAKLRKRVEAAADLSGERVWRMPLFEDYREMMKSKHADIWNSAPVRDAHPVQGAAFLSYFVDPKIPWAHIDIAGSALTDKDNPPFRAGPTGSGVRLLADLLMAWK